MKFDIREAASERVILCAHRGVWGGNIPCNNLLAYDIALAQGADMVEIDVTMAGDGELFIFHPHMERRHIGKDVHLEEMTTEEIKKLRYCNYDGAETEIGLNTLDELLEHLKGRCFINVDKFGDHPAEIIEKIKAMIPKKKAKKDADGYDTIYIGPVEVYDPEEIKRIEAEIASYSAE